MEEDGEFRQSRRRPIWGRGEQTTTLSESLSFCVSRFEGRRERKGKAVGKGSTWERGKVLELLVKTFSGLPGHLWGRTESRHLTNTYTNK